MAAILQIVRRAVAVRLDGIEQLVLVGQFREDGGIVFGEKIGDCAPEIPEETLGDFGAVHHAAGQRRQETGAIIASALLEFPAELWRPVLQTDFIAVDMHTVERLSGKCPHVLDQRRHRPFPVGDGGLPAQLVAFQSGAFLRPGMVAAAVGSVAETHDRPRSRRNIPRQLAVGGHPRRQVHNLVARHNRIGGRRQRIARCGIALSPYLKHFRRKTLDPQTGQKLDLGQGDVFPPCLLGGKQLQAEKPGGHGRKSEGLFLIAGVEGKVLYRLVSAAVVGDFQPGLALGDVSHGEDDQRTRGPGPGKLEHDKLRCLLRRQRK